MRRSGILVSIYLFMAFRGASRLAPAEPVQVANVSLGHSTLPLNLPRSIYGSSAAA